MENTETFSSFEQPQSQSDKESYFDGTLIGMIGICLAQYFMTVLSFLIALPWAVCFAAKWFCSKIVIEGERLNFTGTGVKLFLHIKWFIIIPFAVFIASIILSLPTGAPIYFFGGVFLVLSLYVTMIFAPYFILQYIVKNTSTIFSQQFPQSESTSYFDGKLLGFIGINLAVGLMISFSFLIAYPWAICFGAKWLCKHIVIGGRRLIFTGSGFQFLSSIKWFLLPFIVSILVFSFSDIIVAFAVAYISLLVLLIASPFLVVRYVVQNTSFENTSFENTSFENTSF